MKKQKPLTDAEIATIRDALKQVEEKRRYQAATQSLKQADCQDEVVRGHSFNECPVKSPSPFEMVDDAAGRVGCFADRLNGLASRLAGELPPSPAADGIKPQRPGQLGTVADRADGIFYAVNAMHAALDRIEAQLP